ncbi:MAG: NfeD family protein [Leptolyngbyaceae cyanobacterium bins.59]|nr:NfeD family protein [Leptolyngbyaceae cyanobacterium bins.59]
MGVNQVVGNLPAHSLWAIGGMLCLGFGLVVPEPTIPAIGLAAILTAGVALMFPSAPLQFGVWVGLSIFLTILLRAMVPQPSSELTQSKEAIVTHTIPRGGTGQVLYEGCSWQAKGHKPDVAIAAGQTVLVVECRGVTLIVAPAPPGT